MGNTQLEHTNLSFIYYLYKLSHSATLCVYSFVGHQTITSIGGVYGGQVVIRVLTHLSIIGLYVYMNHPFLWFYIYIYGT